VATATGTFIHCFFDRSRASLKMHNPRYQFILLRRTTNFSPARRVGFLSQPPNAAKQRRSQRSHTGKGKVLAQSAISFFNFRISGTLSLATAALKSLSLLAALGNSDWIFLLSLMLSSMY